jgi:hypothetical protein
MQLDEPHARVRAAWAFAERRAASSLPTLQGEDRSFAIRSHLIGVVAALEELAVLDAPPRTSRAARGQEAPASTRRWIGSRTRRTPPR